ncbi:MAG: hypothetical protein HDT44_07330 [Ruminococcaceae bacterium]|nr:hypothetical protein [Oscillospiraceae bacterium]
MEEIVKSGMGVSDTAVGDVVETIGDVADRYEVGGDDGSKEAKESLNEGEKAEESFSDSEDAEKILSDGEEKGKSLADSEETEKRFLEKEVARLKDEVVRQKEEFDAAVEEMRVKSAVVERLYGVGAKNPGLLVKLIDCSKVGFGEDGGLVGLEEQIGALRENEGYLFEEKRLSDSLGCFRPEESGDLAETGVDFSQMTYSEMIRALGR